MQAAGQAKLHEKPAPTGGGGPPEGPPSQRSSSDTGRRSNSGSEVANPLRSSQTAVTAKVRVSDASNDHRERRSQVDSSDYYNNSSTSSTASHAGLIGRLVPKRLRFKAWMGRKASPRERMGCVFIVSELILGLALMANMLVLRYSITQMSTKTAMSEVKLLDLTYSTKVNQIGYGMKGQAKNSAIIDYLQNGSGADDVESILYSEITARKMEFAMLYATNATKPTILVNAQGNNRSGEVWDPHGLVAKMINSPSSGQIRTSKLVSYDDIMREQPTVFRERVSELQEMDFNHWADVKSSSNLIRYIITPVYTLTTPKTFLGVLLAGDVVEGKTPMVYNALNALGNGFTGIYTALADGQGFRRACSAYYKDDVLGYQLLTAHIDSVPPSLLKAAHSTTPQQTPPIVTKVKDGLVYAAKQLPLGVQNDIAQTTEVTPAVAVRGVAWDQTGLYGNVLVTNLILIGVIMLFNLISLVVALSFFILPLEKLAGRLRAHEKVDMKDVSTLKIGRQFVMGASLTLITSIICIAIMGTTVTKNITISVRAGAMSSVGVCGVSYRIKRDQMSLGFRGQSTNTAVRSLLDDPTNSVLRDKVFSSFRSEVSGRMIEYATLVDKYGKIVINAGENDRWNETWDPTGLANLTLRTNLRYKTTAILPYSEYQAEGPHLWQEKLDTRTANSSLSPHVTHGPALIRYTSTPVYASSNSGTKSPDGVIISGGIINGKVVAAERVLAVLDAGYAGFYLDAGDGTYALATGILKKTKTASLQVDYAVPEEYIKPLLDKVKAHPHLTFTRDVELDGEGIVLAAQRVPLDRFVGAFGDVDMDAHGTPVGFMVYGKPRSSTIELERNTDITTVICAIIQLLTTIFMNYMAYQPLRKLLVIMTRQGFIKPSASQTLWKRFRAFFQGSKPTIYAETS